MLVTARELLAALGIPHRSHRPDDGDPWLSKGWAPNQSWWTGEVLIIGPTEKDYNLYHEIAHWLVCPLEFKRFKNYGLEKQEDGTRPRLDEAQEEVVTCEVSHAIEQLCGIPLDRIRREAEVESFFDYPQDYGVTLPDHECSTSEMLLTQRIIDEGIKWLEKHHPQVITVIQSLKTQVRKDSESND